MKKFDDKVFGFSLNKVLFSIVLLILATAFSFPLFSVEKKMKCFKHGRASKSEAPEFYKYTSDMLGKQKFFVRERNKWEPFCKVTDKNVFARYIDFESETKPLKREVGDKAIECTYLEKVFDKRVIYDYKLSIDFDLNYTKLCYRNDEKKEYFCFDAGKPSMCEVIEE